MTGRTLRVYLPESWPGKDGSCPWALLARDGSVVARGAGDVRHWPAAGECEAIISAGQVAWFPVSLPEKLGRDASQIIAYAAEEKLLGPPESMHLALQRSMRGGKSLIAVARSRLDEILGVVAAAGRRLDRLFAEMQLAPASADQWTVCRHGESAFLRVGTDFGLAIDWTGAAAPPDALILAATQARSRGELPARIAVCAPAEQLPDLDAWTAALSAPVVAGNGFDPLAAPAAAAGNLLTGPYAPRGKTGAAARYLRLTMAIVLLAGLGHTLLSAADWAWLAFRAETLRDEAQSIYREALPGSRAPLPNPALQLKREAAAALRQRGLAGDGDMLPMLALLAGELPPGAGARSVRFDRTTLEMISVLPADALRRMEAAAQARGYALDAAVLRQETSGAEYRLKVYLR